MKKDLNIAGVNFKPLKLITNERGGLLEIQRNDEIDFPGFGQVYITKTYPNIIKAWYRHQKQLDQIVILKGTMKLVLYDSRKQSPSYEVIQEEIISCDKAKLVKIPPLIWHGFQAVNDEELLLMHLNTEPFNFAAPDEERIDAHSSEIPYQW